MKHFLITFFSLNKINGPKGDFFKVQVTGKFYLTDFHQGVDT